MNAPVNSSASAADIARFAKRALDQQDEAAALPIVAAAAERAGHDARLWQWVALLHRALDQRAAALPLLHRAARLAPHDVSIAHGLARTTLEAGLPASALFDAAQRLAPNDGDILLGQSAARAADGDATDAIAGLADVLRDHPGWIAGHEQLARLRWMMGDHSSFAASFHDALAIAPTDANLWRTLVILLIHGEKYDDAATVIGNARAAIGDQPFLTANEAIIHSETGAVVAADASFSVLFGTQEISLAVRFVRHLLRNGRIDAALDAIEPWLLTPEATLMWPYASIVWRMTNDARYAWLEADAALVGVIDLADRLPPLDQLSEVLRGLHRAHDRQVDQSVRGGTQTDGALFARIEPEITAIRATIVAAVADHVAQLPPRDAGHPTLHVRRDRAPRFSGSWSVRLRGAGHHANHVHPAGWLSSVLYISLPSHEERGGDTAGWLSLGSPQAELGLSLGPLRRLEPKPGRLVLFPSTMWHGTEPFADGERLTVAFDIAYPFAAAG